MKRPAKAAHPAYATAWLPSVLVGRANCPRGFPWWQLRLLLGASLCSLLLGCAAEGPPQPPQVERPQAIRDLEARQIGRSVEITLTLPKLTADGRRLTKPIELDLYRTLTPPHQALIPPRVAAKPWVSLAHATLASEARDSRLVHSFTLSPAEFHQDLGSTFSFLAVSLTHAFRGRPLRSPPSNRSELTLLDVTEPVENLTVKVTPKILELRWSAPKKTLAGRPIPSRLSCRVYLRAGRQPSFRLIGTTQRTEFDDSDFQFGQHDSFMVRSVTVQGNVTAESGNSNIAEITPRNTIPPPPPRGLSGIYTAGAVELVWQPDLGSNVAGYRVYRRRGQTPFKLLNPVLVETPVYRDAHVAANRRYIYAVTAVSRSGQESGRSSPFAIETRTFKGREGHRP